MGVQDAPGHETRHIALVDPRKCPPHRDGRADRHFVAGAHEPGPSIGFVVRVVTSAGFLVVRSPQDALGIADDTLMTKEDPGAMGHQVFRWSGKVDVCEFLVGAQVGPSGNPVDDGSDGWGFRSSLLCEEGAFQRVSLPVG